MSKKQALRDLVTERLVAAADEIFALIEEAFAEYEEEVLRLKWAKVQEQKNVRHKEGVQTPSGANHAEEEQTPCDSLDLPFSPLKPEDNINKLSLLQDKTSEENRTGAAEGEPGCSSGSRPARNEKPPSGSDTDDSRDWDTAAGKTTRSNDGESDAAHGKGSPSRKRRKHRKRQHNELNESFVTVKREREEELEAYMQSGTICDSALTDASLAQTSAHAPSPSWISLLSQPPQSTDTVALMHEMLAKQDVLLQQQGQIFTLLSASQLQAPECSLDYKDLPIRDHQGLTGMEVRLQDQDYRTKLDGQKHKGVRGPTQKMKHLQSSPPQNEQSDPGQVRELQTLCNLMGERHRDSPSSPSGRQELFPGSGLFISSFRLAAINHSSQPHCMRLFHALFDHFFTIDECQNAVPFGRPGNNPAKKEGKRLLDRKKVDGILNYVLTCATLPGWDQIEESKLKKAFVNKCRARGSKEQPLLLPLVSGLLSH